jgi:hypothetical protein
MKQALVVIAIVVAGLVLFSATAARHTPYFQPHGCHYIAKKNFMGNHIYVCPKKG